MSTPSQNVLSALQLEIFQITEMVRQELGIWIAANERLGEQRSDQAFDLIYQHLSRVSEIYNIAGQKIYYPGLVRALNRKFKAGLLSNVKSSNPVQILEEEDKDWDNATRQTPPPGDISVVLEDWWTELAEDGQFERPTSPEGGEPRRSSSRRGRKSEKGKGRATGEGKGKGKGKEREEDEAMEVDDEDDEVPQVKMTRGALRGNRCANCVQRNDLCTPGTGRSCAACQQRKVKCEMPGQPRKVSKPETKKRSRSSTKNVGEGSDVGSAGITVSSVGSGAKRQKVPAVVIPAVQRVPVAGPSNVADRMEALELKVNELEQTTILLKVQHEMAVAMVENMRRMLMEHLPQISTEIGMARGPSSVDPVQPLTASMLRASIGPEAPPSIQPVPVRFTVPAPPPDESSGAPGLAQSSPKATEESAEESTEDSTDSETGSGSSESEDSVPPGTLGSEATVRKLLTDPS